MRGTFQSNQLEAQRSRCALCKLQITKSTNISKIAVLLSLSEVRHCSADSRTQISNQAVIGCPCGIMLAHCWHALNHHQTLLLST